MTAASNTGFSVQRLRDLRQAHGLTLQQLADAVGCTKAYIWELESRPGQRPSAQRMLALARVLGTTVEVLMGTQTPTLSPEDSRFLQDYLALPEADRARMRRILKAVSS